MTSSKFFQLKKHYKLQNSPQPLKYSNTIIPNPLFSKKLQRTHQADCKTASRWIQSVFSSHCLLAFKHSSLGAGGWAFAINARMTQENAKRQFLVIFYEKTTKKHQKRVLLIRGRKAAVSAPFCVIFCRFLAGCDLKWIGELKELQFCGILLDVNAG
jgi:hypothetical protein